MASATVSTARPPAGSDADDDADLRLRWSGRFSLKHRILALNLLTVLLVALSTIYLDAFRNRLSEERVRQARLEAAATAGALNAAGPGHEDAILAAVTRSSGSRLRLFGSDGSLISDSWNVTGPTYRLEDPTKQNWTYHVARALDRGFNVLVGASPLEPFIEPANDRLSAWTEAVTARQTGHPVTMIRNAPDLTPVISAAAPTGTSVLLVTTNDPAFTRTVRDQRGFILASMAVLITISILLSSFLARTIVRPLRRLAIAAHRVRQGRAREVSVPRLPDRIDEIGMLARAVSDMSQSLRQRIDSIEAFAADVSHELKNPLASLRSAVDGLERVEDPKLRARLATIVRDDIARMDRLIGDISEAARTDAELARAHFRSVDVGALIERLVHSWEARRETGSAKISYSRPRNDRVTVMGKADRLARALNAILDNAVSFSPPNGLIEIALSRAGDDILIRIDDQGPGVPAEAREAIFNRFHSVRPDPENFGRHSGLGLAIAQAIVNGHDGEIDVQDRDDAPSGARFTIRLPAADSQ